MISEEEVLRSASGGLALKGMYKTGNLEDLLEKRQQLIEVPESFKFQAGVISSLSKCKGSLQKEYSDSLLRKVQLSISKFGGPAETDDHLKWKSGLLTSNSRCLKVMMQSVMDQAHGVEDFPNRSKILKWAKLTEEELPKVPSVTQFSDLERILNEVKDGFNNPAREIEFPLWALRQIKKTLRKKQQHIFNVPVPIVSFVRLGISSTNSKSQILSNIISKQKHPVFFNRHCNGSMRHCLLMDGVVEIVWYCGGSNDRDVFDDCVAFVNLHGDASDHPAQLRFLQEVSSVTVLLHSENALENRAKEQSEEKQTLYMLQWLQIFLEEYTTDIHDNLQEKYHSIWTEMRQKPQGEDKELERKLVQVSEEIRAISVGLQHLMREMSQLYEAVHSVAMNEDFTDVRCVDILPRIGAEMLIAGYPLELMDGDVAHVPLEWIKAVFDKLILKLGDKKVFVLSVLGVQSSGKSTLLNTMFGLQFAVSAGRCTRGAFMQLLEVDEEMRANLQFDFVLVVDTEGLRSPELSSEATLCHDNELATFIIGVGNMTLINIMGENPCEMQDILQICVQAFMRMTSVRINTSCIFVHQNVSETTASEKNQEGRRHLQNRLDQMTAIAANEENLDIKRFSDIIQFDVDSQVFYFTNLLEGDPPMARPNPSYSQNVQELKNKLFSIAQGQPGCNLPTLSEVKERIKDLWDALLRENFVFSFRNTLEIAVYSKLEKFYGQWSWSIRKHALEIQQSWRNKINSNLKDAVNVLDLMKEFDETYKTLTAAPEALQIQGWGALFYLRSLGGRTVLRMIHRQHRPL
ncbi:hypothetical protein AAFF_G00303090 [Aldrovandia affinis]|uniref:VLIG-type G domain-containing protein n=1 Tax=Aldrovandia affinis TaxID=143900 RepID=A0AAD7R8T3_9TELE|nr:hypothetical protein AAFF_G00303090 [Aldrovandia affinis]